MSGEDDGSLFGDDCTGVGTRTACLEGRKEF